jgi:SPP1 gp7 family putative phage head morphogenesis protein
MACVRANEQLSGDPTNTRSLRQAFIDALRRRTRRVRGQIRRGVGYQHDALRLTGNADTPEDFGFERDPDRVDAFYRWVKRAIRDEVLEPVPDLAVRRGEHWTAAYARRAYVAGHEHATGLLFRAGASVRTRDEATILELPVAERTLRRLYTRAFEALKGVSDAAATTLREELSRGLAAGESPRKLADRLTESVRSIERSRLATIARTEIVHAHSEATLDRYDEAGVDAVSHSEWATAGDDRVCPVCAALEGREFTTAEMRDTTFELPGISYTIRLAPPAHPNCRCAILPVIGGTPPETPLSERLPNEPVEA